MRKSFFKYFVMAILLVKPFLGFTVCDYQIPAPHSSSLCYSLECTKIDLLQAVQEFEAKIRSLSQQLDSIQYQIDMYYPYNLDLINYANSIRLSVNLFQSVLELNKKNELDRLSMNASSLLFKILNLDFQQMDMLACPCYSLYDIYERLSNDLDDHFATVCYLLVKLIDIEMQKANQPTITCISQVNISE